MSHPLAVALVRRMNVMDELISEDLALRTELVRRSLVHFRVVRRCFGSVSHASVDLRTTLHAPRVVCSTW